MLHFLPNDIPETEGTCVNGGFERWLKCTSQNQRGTSQRLDDKRLPLAVSGKIRSQRLVPVARWAGSQ